MGVKPPPEQPKPGPGAAAGPGSLPAGGGSSPPPAAPAPKAAPPAAPKPPVAPTPAKAPRPDRPAPDSDAFRSAVFDSVGKAILDTPHGKQHGFAAVSEIRKAIDAKFGAGAFRREDLDEAMLQLWRDGKVRLIPAFEQYREPQEIQDGALPGLGGKNFLWIEPKEKAPAPAASAPSAAPPAPAPTPPTPASQARPSSEKAARLAGVLHGGATGGLKRFTIADLAKATKLRRPDLLAAVEELRRAGLVTATGAEGRHRLSAEDRKHAIEEGNDLLTHLELRDESGGDIRRFSEQPPVKKPRAPRKPKQSARVPLAVQYQRLAQRAWDSGDLHSALIYARQVRSSPAPRAG